MVFLLGLGAVKSETNAEGAILNKLLDDKIALFT